MKTQKIIFTALMFLMLMTVSSCEQKSNEPTLDGINVPLEGCVVMPSYPIRYQVFRDGRGKFGGLEGDTRSIFLLSPNIDLTYEQVNEWKSQPDMKALADHMNEQFSKIVKTPAYAGYLYGTLKGVSIKANRSIYGIEAGKELRDLFCLYIGTPVFSYPQGDMINEGGPQCYDIDEWISGNYMLNASSIALTVKDHTLPAGVVGEVDFTITIELSSGKCDSAIVSQTFK